MTDVSFVIVNWNTSNLLKQCLSSIKFNTSKYSFKIYVVDNASTDDSVSMVKKYYPEIKLTVNNVNIGFAKANNQILKSVNSKYFIILNPDTVLIKGSVDKLLQVMENDKSIVVCGPKLINPDGSIQSKGYYRKFPSLLQTVLFYTDLYRICIKNNYLVKKYWESNIKTDSLNDVDQIPGACLLVRKDTLDKIGYFDEDYPVWFEDVDLCWRIKKASYRIVYVPDSNIVHLGGASFDKWKDRGRKETRFWLSLFIFYRKNKSIVGELLVRLILLSSIIFSIISRSIMQIFSYDQKRKNFICLKLEILWKLYFINSALLPDNK